MTPWHDGSILAGLLSFPRTIEPSCESVIEIMREEA